MKGTARTAGWETRRYGKKKAHSVVGHSKQNGASSFPLLAPFFVVLAISPPPARRSRTVSYTHLQADRDIWDEFSANWDELGVESEIAYAQLSGVEIQSLITPSPEPNIENVEFSGLTEAERKVKVRLGQQFFRKVIMTSYSSKCCVCGMPIPELLIASHIIPWRDDKHLRVSPHNGLCLCTLHDKGFDRGFFTLAEDYKIVIGEVMRQYLPNSAVHNGFKIYEGQMISLPDKFIPRQEFLAIHRDSYFLG